MNIQSGLFITLEGIEGVGKTTQLGLLAETLRKSSLPVLVTREPGGTPIGNEIREVLLKRRADSMNEMTELLLMFAARAQHLSQMVWPALAEGQIVICDRFTDASFAYQGGGRGLPIKYLQQLEQMVQRGFKPSFTFILDAEPTLGLERIKARGQLDRIEEEQLHFFERVRAGYLQQAKMEPQRCHVINADQPPEAVHQAIWATLCSKLNLSLS